MLTRRKIEARFVADEDLSLWRKDFHEPTPLFPASGPATGSFNGLHPKSKFLAVAADGSGNACVADANNHTIRKITPEGTVTTLAGLSTESGSADGTGTEAHFAGSRGLTVDGSGTAAKSRI